MEWWIHIRSYGTEAVAHKVGPYTSYRQADKADNGLNRNLDHDRFYTEIIEPLGCPQPSLTQTETDK
jgi:hypothetical protein